MKNYTFDNPKNPQARWGKIIKVCNKTKRVWLEFIGWGYFWELKE